MLKVIKFLIPLVYALLLTAAIPHLLARTSGASQAILGRYSLTYAAILLFYTLFVAFAWSLVWKPPQFLQQGLWLMMGAYLLSFIHIAFVLFFAVWDLPDVPLASALLSLILGPAALAMSAAKQGRWLGRLVLCYGSLGFSLLMMEWVARVLFPYGIREFDIFIQSGEMTAWRPMTGWAAPSNALYYHIQPKGFFNEVQTNASGLHARPISYEKPAEVYRILIVGDSFTYAAEVAIEEMYTTLLEAALNARGYRVEVIPAAQRGWSTDQQLLYLTHEGCRYQPDLVLLQFAPNDPEGNLNPQLPKPYYQLEADGALTLRQFPYDKPYQPPQTSGVRLLNPILAQSRLALLLWGITTNLSADYTAANTSVFNLPMYNAPLQVIQQGPEAWDERYWPLTRALIAAIADTAENCGAQFGGFALPIFIEDYQSMPVGGGRLYRYQNEQFYATLAELGIPHPPIEAWRERIAEFLAAQPESALIYERDGHYTPSGHVIIAQALADWLQDTPWLAKAQSAQ